MGTNKVDRRILRTRKRLQEGLIELILEKGYDRVTINDILERADVGRSTLYAHYQDKEDLLSSCFDPLHQAFEEHTQLVLSSPNLEALEQDTFHAFCLVILHYIQANHRLFKAVVGRQSRAGKLEDIRIMLTHHIRNILIGINQADLAKHEIAMTIEYAVNGLFAMIIWWIDEDMPCPVEECADLVIRLIEPGLYGVLNIQ